MAAEAASSDGRRRRPYRLIAVLATAAALALGHPAFAADPGGGTLQAGGMVRWSGALGTSALADDSPCRALVAADRARDGATGCDEFRLKIELPSGFWSGSGAGEADRPWSRDGVLVALAWSRERSSFLNDVDLYVYKRRPSTAPELVGSSTGTPSSGEAAFLPTPDNGDYHVVALSRLRVEPAATGFPESCAAEPAGCPSLPYQGTARVERGVREPRLLLPDLAPMPPRTVTFDTGVNLTGFFAVGFPRAGLTNGCYPSEIADGARRCLRYDQTVANVGEGPLELRAEPLRPEGNNPQEIPMLQHLYHGTRPDDDQTSPVGAGEFHLGHLHLHYSELVQTRLLSSGAGGRIVVAPSKKNGFCFVDTQFEGFGRPSVGPWPRTFRGAYDQTQSDCVLPNRDLGPEAYQRSGITPNWADTYPWYLESTYIEVSGVEDGTYTLEMEVNASPDPSQRIIEATHGNNSTSTFVCIRGDRARVGRC